MTHEKAGFVGSFGEAVFISKIDSALYVCIVRLMGAPLQPQSDVLVFSRVPAQDYVKSTVVLVIHRTSATPPLHFREPLGN